MSNILAFAAFTQDVLKEAVTFYSTEQFPVYQLLFNSKLLGVNIRDKLSMKIFFSW